VNNLQVPSGYNVTFAQMGKTEKNKISHRFKAFRQFKSFANQRMNSYMVSKLPETVLCPVEDEEDIVDGHRRSTKLE
jgi:Ham1 family